MPIYEYHCRSCGKVFERLQKISDSPLVSCPKCGKKVKRLISHTSFSLKGGGWFKDGYTSKSSVAGEKPQAGGEATAKDTKKTEKVEKKSEKSQAKGL